jgi:hypothetical protein
MNQIIIVYYIFINPKKDWRKIIKGQLGDLKIVGLTDVSKIYISICGESKLTSECTTLIKDELCIDATFSYTVENQFEYPGFNLLYSIANENPNTPILYIHTKGMVFHNENNRLIYEKALLRGTIDNWKETLKIFDENKIINKIGMYPSDEGWLWFNYFWIRSDYLIGANPPSLNTENRFYYESYIGRIGRTFF